MPFDAPDILAFDRASARRIDVDGRLHVAGSPISKANVCPYLGREIPGAEMLGLAPDRVYRLYRDPAELARGAGTFANLPILSRHVPVSAMDHQPDLVVGSTGTDAEFDGTYLRASLVVWAAGAIAGIETEQQRELSAAYRYRADMTAGEADGVPYDGVMRDIVGNHVALVETGRAGSDVVVGDSAEIIMAKTSRGAAYLGGALTAYLLPKLAQDAKIDLGPVLKDVTAKNWAAKRGAVVATLTGAAAGKLAADASLADMPAFLERLAMDADMDADMDDEDEIDEEKAKLFAKKAIEKKAEDEDEDDKDKVDKPAMDAAIAAAESRTVARMNAIFEAKRAVHPFVGEITTAMDSAADVYKLALDAAGVDLTGAHSSAYAAMVRMLPKPGAVPAVKLAADAALASHSLAAAFPGLARITRQ